MPRLHRARWVLPIDRPPLVDGWVAVDNGTIAAVGGPDDNPPAGCAGGASTDPSIAILPGLVNAHTHLELSWLRGQVPPGEAMPDWAARLIAARRVAGEDAREPIAAAIREARACGTALVGDVSNSLASCEPLAASPLCALVLLELIGFNASDPDALIAAAHARLRTTAASSRMRAVLAAHAPYSVAPALLQAIHGGGERFCIHLAESREELRFLRDGSGAWRRLLESLGAWTDRWQPPESGPVDYLDRLGLVDDRLVAVHGVHLTDSEMERLAAANATVVACPRSNRWTGAGAAPVERLYASGVRVAVGTDSLASVDDLNMFGEIAVMRTLAPAVAARRLLESATLEGARALGFAATLGSIATGKRADLLSVRIPAGITDVEEYLVGGVEPHDIAWLPLD